MKPQPPQKDWGSEPELSQHPERWSSQDSSLGSPNICCLLLTNNCDGPIDFDPGKSLSNSEKLLTAARKQSLDTALLRLVINGFQKGVSHLLPPSRPPLWNGGETDRKTRNFLLNFVLFCFEAYRPIQKVKKPHNVYVGLKGMQQE